MYTVYLVHGISFECYTKGSNGEILKDFKEGVIILCILEISFWVQCRDWAGEGRHKGVRLRHLLVMQLVELFIAK